MFLANAWYICILPPLWSDPSYHPPRYVLLLYSIFAFTLTFTFIGTPKIQFRFSQQKSNSFKTLSKLCMYVASMNMSHKQRCIRWPSISIDVRKLCSLFKLALLVKGLMLFHMDLPKKVIIVPDTNESMTEQKPSSKPILMYNKH